MLIHVHRSPLPLAGEPMRCKFYSGHLYSRVVLTTFDAITTGSKDLSLVFAFFADRNDILRIHMFLGNSTHRILYEQAIFG